MRIYSVLLGITALVLFLTTLTIVDIPGLAFLYVRILVCGVALYALFQERRAMLWRAGLLLIAFFFNPFVPIYFTPTVWRIIALATAATFIRLVMLERQQRT